MRDHLMSTVQGTLIGRLDGMLSSVTVMAVAVVSVLCLGGAYLVRVLTESSWR